MVFWILLGVVAAVVLLTVLVNGILALLQLRYVAGIAPVQYKNQLQPQPLDGRWVFTTDRDFRVMQLTDVHIGGGWMSFFKDRRAIDCVVRMVTAEQPDLVWSRSESEFEKGVKLHIMGPKPGDLPMVRLKWK